MQEIVKELLIRIESAKSLETAHAFATATLLLLGHSESACVVLEGVADGQRIPVIKELRTLFNLSLKEAKDECETPLKKWGPFPRLEAQRVANALKAVGAIVRLS